jgi:hypothetical protein
LQHDVAKLFFGQVVEQAQQARLKTVGNFRRTRYKGRERTQLAAYLVGTACNLIRMAKLLPQPA